MVIELELDIEESSITAKINRMFSGLTAQQFQFFWNFLTKDRKEEILSTVMDVGLQDADLISYETRNDKPEDIGRKNMEFEVEVKSEHVIEKAGNDIIIRIGEVIGEQAELYNAKKRKLPIQIDVLRGYYRKIVLNIPKGYTVNNIEDLNMNVSIETEGKVSAMFKSYYELEDGKLIVYNQEYYSESNYPIECYEEFRDVINAAADFNKRTVLLTRIN